MSIGWPADGWSLHGHLKRDKSGGNGKVPPLAPSSPGGRQRWNYNIGVAPSDSVDITALLKAWGQGDQRALEELTPLVYAQLRAQARRCMRRALRREVQSTALVHEAYLRLVNVHDVDWHDRVHFFALSAQIMRRILIDAARARAASKRGGGDVRAEHSSAVDLDQIPTDDSNAATCSARSTTLSRA